MIAWICCACLAGSDPQLAAAAWLAGPWVSVPEEKLKFEEYWTSPREGSMVGTFKLSRDSRPLLYEFQLIEQQSDGVWLRLRHYGPGMVDRDERPARLKLTAADPSQLVFTNPDGDKPRRITYSRTAERDRLTVTVETSRDGKPAAQTLKFARPPEKSTADADGRSRNPGGGG